MKLMELIHEVMVCELISEGKSSKNTSADSRCANYPLVGPEKNNEGWDLATSAGSAVLWRAEL